MKRDIFFSEVTPLSFKEEISSRQLIMPIISVFQLLIIACSLVWLPSIEESCGDSPLYLWASLMVLILNLHLVLASIERITIKLRGNESCIVAHGLFIGLILIWMGFGHFFTFFQGIGCIETQDFWLASSMLVTMDLVGLSILVYVLVQF